MGWGVVDAPGGVLRPLLQGMGGAFVLLRAAHDQWGQQGMTHTVYRELRQMLVDDDAFKHAMKMFSKFVGSTDDSIGRVHDTSLQLEPIPK